MAGSYGIYIRVDGNGCITEINSEGLLEDLSGYIRIDEYESGVPYAQGDYFGKPIIDERGVWRYAYDPESERKWRERTAEEMDADAAQIVIPMSETDAALVELAAMMAELTAGVTELAALVAGGE